MKNTLVTLLEIVAQENILTERSRLYLDTVATQITILEKIASEHASIGLATQRKHGMWRNLNPAVHGRWLTREVDRLRPCANS
jgi:hypothetical protein